jgi:hypothetical protein
MNPTETNAENQTEREGPMFCGALLARPPEFERPAELREPIDFARSLVIELLGRTGLGFERMLDPRTLRVIVGGGNWISFECALFDSLAKSAQALAGSLPERERGRILGLEKSLERKVWFRTAGRPSLHYFVEMKDGRLRLRGHVDAAAPRKHPLRHLVRDYLPAHGIGVHPEPERLWRDFNGNRRT